MKLSQSSSLISFLLILAMVSPSESAEAHTASDESSSATIEDRIKRISSALQERETQLDLDPDVAPEVAPLVAQFRNAFRNGGGFRNGGFRNGGGFANRPGGGGFANRVSGGGFLNSGPGWRNGFRNSPGFYNYRR